MQFSDKTKARLNSANNSLEWVMPKISVFVAIFAIIGVSYLQTDEAKEKINFQCKPTQTEEQCNLQRLMLESVLYAAPFIILAWIFMVLFKWFVFTMKNGFNKKKKERV